MAIPRDIQLQTIPYRERVEDTATLFAANAHTYPDLQNFFHKGVATDESISEFTYRAVPVDSINTLQFRGNEWMYAVGARVEKQQCHLAFELGNNAFPRQVRWRCDCGQRSDFCRHVIQLGHRFLEDSRVGTLAFDGIRAHINLQPGETSETSATLTETFLERELARLDRKTREQIGIEKQLIGLKLTPPNLAAPGTFGLLPVAIRVEGRKHTVETTPLPDLSSLDHADQQIAPAEYKWLRHILSISADTSPTRCRVIRQPLDIQALKELAADGRLIGPHGKRIRFAPTGAQSVISWEPVTEETQQLRVKRPAPWIWLSMELSVAYDPNAAQMVDLGVSKALLDRIAKWPPLSIADAKAVHTLWNSHPVLKALPAPLAMDELPIRQAKATWRAVVTLQESSPSDIYDTQHYRVVFVAVADGKPLPAGHERKTLVKGEGEWIRYDLDSSLLLRAIERLRTLLFTPQRTNTELQAHVAAFNSAEKAMAAIRAVLDERIEVVAIDLPVVRVLSPHKVHTPACRIDIAPLRGQQGLYQLDLVATIDTEVADVPHATKEQAVHHVAPERFQLKEGGKLGHLREIAPRLYAYVDEDTWTPFLRSARALLALAKKRGKTLTLTRGAILAIARDGIDLFGHVQAVDDANAETAEILTAKRALGPVHVDGIDDCTYAPFQGTAINWLMSLRAHGFGGVLADDRGLGKTLEALGAIAQYRNQERAAGKQAPPALVVMERKEIDGWTRECRKHLGSLDVHWEHGATRLRSTQAMADKDIVLTTYNVLLQNRDLFRNLQPHFVFLDEAKAVKNAASQRWQAAASFETASVIPVTGTPVDRNINDMWSLVELAVPGLLGSQSDFRARFGSLIGRDDPLAKAQLQQIRAILAPFVLRRLKSDVAEQLPKKNQITQLVTLSEAQAKAYEAARERLETEKNAIFEALPLHKARFKVHATIDKLRELCAKVGTKERPTDKGDFLIEMTQELLQSDHRILIFSHFNAVVEAISERLKRVGISNATYVGGNANKRDREMRLFKDGHVDVLVLSEWGSSGLDLPEADIVIIADSWINSSQDDQMGDRAHRFISKHEVTVFKLALANTIEDAAIAILERSRQSTEALFSDTGEALQSIALTREDYDRLFAISPVE